MTKMKYKSNKIQKAIKLQRIKINKKSDEAYYYNVIHMSTQANTILSDFERQIIFTYIYQSYRT